MYWSVPTAWQFVLSVGRSSLEGEHFAGEPSPNSLLQGVLVQEAKELFGGGLKGCLAQRKIVSFIIFLQISSQSHK